MVVGVTIIITSFVYCSIISLFYWSKKKPKNIENRIYAFLVMDTLLGLLLELGCCFTVLYEKQIPVLFKRSIIDGFISSIVYYLCSLLV